MTDVLVRGRSVPRVSGLTLQVVAGSEVRLTLEEEHLAAIAGCHTLTGSATWEDGVLQVEQPMALTMMAVQPGPDPGGRHPHPDRRGVNHL